MTQISLIHVGDIHYPDNKGTAVTDLKDKGLSAGFTASLGPLRLKSAMDALLRVIEEKPDVRGILSSGARTAPSRTSP
jgi:hypothetical protein